MNNEQFLKALKQALNALDKAEREDILREIASYAEDSSASLHDRLGDPDELAQQYLDGTPPTLPLAKKALSIGMKIIMGFVITLILIIIIGVVVVWQLSQDPFDYADTTAEELNITGADWQHLELSTPLTIEVDQAKVAFYWSDDNQLHWQCKGEKSIEPKEGVFRLRHQSCLVFLPPVEHTINADQASVVIVEPKANVNARLYQSQIRMAQGDTDINYMIKGERFIVSDILISDSQADIQMKVEAFESAIEEYVFGVSLTIFD